MAEEKTSHKGMGGEYLPREWFIQRNLHTLEDPRVSGGVVWDSKENPAGFVKPPRYRLDPNSLTTTDFVPLPHALEKGKQPTRLGMEIEVIYIDENGNPRSAAEIRDRNNLSIELGDAMAEANLQPYTDAQQRAVALVDTLKMLDREGIIHPFSNFERQLRLDEVTPNPYVQRIVESLGFERLQDFTATGIHMHKEWLNPEVALDLINRAELVFGPLLLALSSDAPIDRMSTHPNIGEIFTHEDPTRVSPEVYRALNYTGMWHTTRYAKRVLGSSHAGTLPEPLNASLTGFYQDADEVLQAGKAVSVARTKQNHGNFRYRPEFGTIEVCIPDKAGLHMGRIMLMQEFMRHALIRMEAVLAQGQLNQYASRYPLLFAKGPVTTQQLQRAQLSNIEVAKHGVEAEIYAADGKQYDLGKVMNEMLRFLNEEMTVEVEEGELHIEAFQHLERAIRQAITVVPQETFDKHKTIPIYRGDTFIGNAVSPSGYYTLHNMGSASQWMHATIKSLEDMGLSEEEVIRETRRIYSSAIHSHISQFNVQELLMWLTQSKQTARRTVSTGV